MPTLTFEDFDRLGRELLESGWAGRADETVADLKRREQVEAIALAGAGDAADSSAGDVAARADAAAAHAAGSGLLGAAPLRPARVLEVVGPTGSGKTEVLYHAAARFLVSSALEAAEEGRRRQQQQHGHDRGPPPPPSGPPPSLHHHHQHAVLLDMDGKLSLERLHRIASAHAKAAYRGYVASLAAAAEANEAAAAGAAAAAAAAAAAGELLAPGALLQRLHVAQPRSSLELLATLAALPERMARLGGRWRLLLMDGAGAFAWRDRAAGQGGGGAGGGGGGGIGGQEGGAALSHMRAQTAAADLVAALGERLRVATVVTRRARVTRQLGGGGGGGGMRRSSDGGEDGGGGGGGVGVGLTTHGRLVASEQPAPRWQALISQRLVLAPPPPLPAALAQQLAVPGSATALLAQWQRPGGGGGGGGAGGAGGGAVAGPHGGQPPPPPPVGLWALDDGRLVEDGSGTVATNRAWLAGFS